jgi:hypothetical protein
MEVAALGASSRQERLDIPRRTLMRTPLVKRQTTPMSGFFLFFRFPGSDVVSSQSCALT